MLMNVSVFDNLLSCGFGFLFVMTPHNILVLGYKDNIYLFVANSISVFKRVMFDIVGCSGLT
jgi:hypothetical protein